jgi:pantoate--beta-alanine ligase
MNQPVLVFKKLAEILDWRIDQIVAPGVVMTMGNLHAGHLSLIRTSAQEHDTTVVTIFVNPKQFGPSEDFDRYPRTLHEDLALIQNLVQDFPHRKFIVFAPSSIDEIYGENFVTSVRVDHFTQKLCGLSRPTHFEGVTTVVARLLGITKPHVAYYGQKDFQQFFVIKKMAENLMLPYEICCCPIVRDEDGLALSSRNAYLSKDEREIALSLARAIVKLSNEVSSDRGALENLEHLSSFKKDYQHFEYLEILDANTLETINNKTQTMLIAGAIKVGKTRLIDNALVNLKSGPNHD